MGRRTPEAEMGARWGLPALPTCPSSSADTAVPLEVDPEWEGPHDSASPQQNAFCSSHAAGVAWVAVPVLGVVDGASSEHWVDSKILLILVRHHRPAFPRARLWMWVLESRQVLQEGKGNPNHCLGNNPHFQTQQVTWQRAWAVIQ